MPGAVAYSGTENQADVYVVVIILKYYNCQKYFRVNFLPPSPQNTLKLQIHSRPILFTVETKGVYFLVLNFLRAQVLYSIG